MASMANMANMAQPGAGSLGRGVPPQDGRAGLNNGMSDQHPKHSVSNFHTFKPSSGHQSGILRAAI
jgi:hypothetical protein